MAFINDLIAQLESTGRLKVTKPDGTTVSSHQLDIIEPDGQRYTVWKGKIEITYKVDTDTTYQEYVYYGTDLLSPTTFTPSKSGYTFVGWREDSTANSSVLTSKTCGYEPVTLYAVFEKTVTVTCFNLMHRYPYDLEGYQYYNNGNIVNPSFTLDEQETKTGWTPRGWGISTAADSEVVYTSGVPFEMSSDITVYGLYYAEYTLTYYDNSATAKTIKRNAYFSSWNQYSFPYITMTQSSKTGWTARGWATTNKANATIDYANGASIKLDKDITIYGCYTRDYTLTYYDGSTTKATKAATAYYNAVSSTVYSKVTMTQTAKDGWTARGWSTGTAGNATIDYNDGYSIEVYGDMTIYGCYYQTITITYYNNSTTAATSDGTRYWNSAGNYVNPTFTIAQATKTGWTARGWATGTAGNADVVYSSISGREFSSNVTVYGLYYKDITWTFISYNSTQTDSGTCYYNSSGNFINATITAPTGASYSGWTWRGWSDRTNNTGANADVTYSNGWAFEASGSATSYGLYYQDITISYNGNGATGGSTASHTATRYYNAYGNTSNPTVTLATNGFTRSNYKFVKWASGSASGTQYNEGGTVQLSASTTFYAIWEILATPVYWFNRVTNDDGSESQVLTSGYQGSWTETGRCCDDAYITNDIWNVYLRCNNHDSYFSGTASGATGGNPYVTIYITQMSAGSWLEVNGTKITSTGTHKIDISGLTTLTLSLYVAIELIHINYIYFHS